MYIMKFKLLLEIIIIPGIHTRATLNSGPISKNMVLFLPSLKISNFVIKEFILKLT